MASDDDSAPEREQRLWHVLDAYLRAVDSGAVPNRREWLAQYPEFAEELGQFLDQQDRLMKLTEPLHAIAAGAGIGIVNGRDSAGHDRNGFDEDGQQPDKAAPANGSVGRPAGSSGHSFGDYELLEEIAHGGMGTIFKARQRSLNRPVALKLVAEAPWPATTIASGFARRPRRSPTSIIPTSCRFMRWASTTASAISR